MMLDAVMPIDQTTQHQKLCSQTGPEVLNQSAVLLSVWGLGFWVLGLAVLVVYLHGILLT